MVLGGSFLGVSPLLGVVQFPSPSSYDTVKIYGSGIFDYDWVRNFEMTETEIKALVPGVQQVWDGTTIMLANFNNNLGGGSVESITSPITGFDVNRRKEDEITFTRLAEVDENTSEYNDLTAEPNTTYIYEILAKNDTEISEPILADPFDSDFYNWLLIDPDTGTTYIFNLNLQTDAFNNEVAFQQYDGYNKYSQYSFGDRDFVTGSVSALVSSETTTFSDGITQTVEYLDQLRTFINNKQEKILKSRKGHVLRVITTGYTSTALDDVITDQPYIVSFTFKEVGEVIQSGN